MKKINWNKLKLPILSKLKKERNAREAKNVENLLKTRRNSFGKTKRRLSKK